MGTDLSTDLARLTDGSDGYSILVVVLLASGQTVRGWDPFMTSEGFLSISSDAVPDAQVRIDPAQVVATYVPENENTPLPWSTS